ncbi:hypothetical protein P4O66_021800 [Electrophorus voltai]|uniref:ribonuclease H n=1 Tax=Electrophorus voltai TaxID=2609070 RepID=A0AAD9E541_9TELE|nr:hypothetical protein P4O66_021800 [Electrophorus voltai]
MEFRTLAAGSKWNEPALVDVFLNSLRAELQAEIACKQEVASLNEAMQLVITYDRLLQEKRQYLDRRRPYREDIPSGGLVDSSEEPMQLGGAEVCRNPRERKRNDCWEEEGIMGQYIKEALQQGYICPSTSPASAGVFFVKKRDGGLRLCVYLVLPYGLATAPLIFQAYINQVLRECLNRSVVAYIDEILIYSSSWNQHVHDVRAVLQVLLHNHLFCKLEKCEFHKQEVNFLGYIIREGSMRMQPGKVASGKMAPVRSAAVTTAPTSLHTTARISYSRDALISLNLHSTHLKPSVTPGPRWPTEILRENRGRGARKRPRGKRAGVRNRLRAQAHQAPLPSILLANVQSLDNKLDDLRARIKFQRDIRDCNLLCFTESWLNPAVPNHAIQPAEFFSVHRMDRTADSGKSRGSRVCVMVNNSWCNNANVVTLACSCSPNLELLALKLRPFYLPREFTSVIINTVYIPPQANMDTALCELHEALTQFQAQHRDAALIVVGDFNSANLKRAVPNLYQHVTFPTRGNGTLDHCYTPYKGSYKALAHPPFGKSDHAAIFLLPKYKQRLKQEAPVQREVARWTDQSVAALQDALDDADWDMFQRSTDDVSEFTEAVVGFIGKLVDDTIPRITIKKFSNQKPWVDRTIREALNSRTAAYNAGIISGNMDEYKSAAYGVRRAVREAKRGYGKKLETQFQQSGSRSLWQGLWMITDYRSPPSGLMSADESLANELNTFFARFEATSSSANASSTNANSASANSANANSANANSANANGASANGTIGAANGTCAGPTIEQRPLIITESDMRRVFKRVNTRKAVGPDGICGRVLKACADQLAPVFTDIFNLSLTLGIVPSSFKRSTIVPVPKKPRPSSDLNDYRPVALTSVVMKCFEKLVRDFITSSLPASMDPLQFAYRHNRSTDDAIAHLLHTTLTYLDEGRGNYVKMLFVDYSSAFNTIIPSLLTTKLGDLGLHTSLCDWISNFLTDRPQSVRVGNCSSTTLTLSTGAPQGCVLSLLLYSLYTYDCTATSSSNIIVKFADDTVVVGLISDDDERAYLEEIKHLENWCQENNLLLNVSKTKELIVDCSKKQERHYQPVRISGTTVERVDSFRYLGVHISQDLSWSRHTSSLAKKARQRLYHLRCLRDFRLPSKVLRNFYTCTIESILTGNITVWFGNSTKQDRQALQRVVRSAERITHSELPDLQTIYYKRCQTKARKIVKDPTHPNNRLFSLLRSGRRFRSLKTKTERLKRSFFPQAIRALNQGN